MLKAINSHINNEFGSRRAFLSTIRFELIGVVGGFSRLRQVDWGRVDRLVFVCMGNICRSPLAEAVARSLSVPAVSAGIDCGDGDHADPRAVAFGKCLGLDLTGHRSVPIGKVGLGAGDLLVGMEPGHLAALPVMAGCAAQQTLLGLWGAPRKVYIHDPFNTSGRFFEKCEQYVAGSASGLVRAWGRWGQGEVSG